MGVICHSFASTFMINTKSPDRLSALIVTTLGIFLITFMAAALNIALPTIGRELAMDAISLSWVNTSYLMVSVMLVIPFGRIADICGRKKIFSWGMILFAVTSILLSLTNNGAMLLTLRFVQGVGGAMVNSTYISLLTSTFPLNERGRALGLNASSVYAGFSLGPFIGGLLTQHFGWRSVFWTVTVIGLIVLFIIFWRMKGDWVEARGEKFDIAGSVMYSIMIVTITYGFTHLPGILGILLIGIGIIVLVAFVVWEMRSTSPVLEINLFRKNRIFTFSCLATLINYGATYAVGFMLSLYLQYIKGYSPQSAGFILIIQPILLVALSPFAGRLSDRIQPRLVASAGMFCNVIGLGLFVYLGVDTGLILVFSGLVLIGLGIAFFAAPNINSGMSAIKPKFLGVASATITTMRQLGMVLSMGIVMLLFALYMGTVQITPEYHQQFLQSIKVTFIIFSALSLLGVAASMARGTSEKIG